MSYILGWEQVAVRKNERGKEWNDEEKRERIGGATNSKKKERKKEKDIGER